jgi:hypothetical protein
LRARLVIGAGCVVVSLIGPLAAVWGSPVIVSESDSHIDLFFDIGEAEEVAGDGGQWSGVAIPGFISVCGDSAGFSAPARAYLVAVPLDANVTCQVSDAAYYDIDNYTTAPVLGRLGSGAGDIPAHVAEITADGFFRDQRIAALRVAPLVYDRQAGVVRVYTHFRVSIDFGRPADARDLGAGRQAGRGDKYEAAYRAALLNYEQGRRWRRTPKRAVQQGDYFTDSPNWTWVKIRVDSTGIYCVTGRDLADAGVTIGDIDPATIRVYSGGGLPLKESLADSNPSWMRPVPVKISGGDDGAFGTADSILFYGLGMRDWADLFDKDRAADVYYKSFFSTYNCYWLAWGGTFSEEPARMETVVLPGCDGCAPYEPDAFFERVHMESDVYANFSVRADDGWYWRRLRTDSPTDFYVSTPAPDAAKPARVRVCVADWFDPDIHDCGDRYYRVTVELNGPPAIKDTTWHAITSNRQTVNIEVGSTDRMTASDTQWLTVEAPSDLDVEGNVCDQLYMAWLEFYYWRLFTARGDRLFFPAPDTSGTVKYEIDGFNSPAVYVFDVTDQFDVKELVGAEMSAGTAFKATIYDTLSEGSRRRYAVVSRGALRKPDDISEATISNIRYAAGASYCVVTHEDLLDAATTIAAFRDGEVVTTGQIYDEFGWGVPDVTAIRDFLRWRYQNGSLDWVLLLGDATWDYKGYIAGAPFPNYVPSYERRYLLPFGSPYNTDDWFAYLVPVRNDSVADYPTVGIARLPAASAEEAMLLVSKQIDYASNPERGPWQNRVILIADDDHLTSGCEASSPHTGNVEQLSDEAYPQVFEHIKIYLVEYPMEPSGLKPKAKNDLIRYLNRGALMTNFVGHGDQYRWTQEEVFNPAAVDLVATGRRETFLIAASCNVSKFDEPDRSSVAETLLRRPGGGTIGSLASTHLAFPLPNQHLNLNVVRRLFPSGDKDPTVPIADAVALGKWLTVSESTDPRGYWENDELYALFGDPAQELATPLYDIVFDTPVPDTLLRQTAYELDASIHDAEGVAAWSGVQADIYVREAEDTSGYVSCYPGVFFDYELPGLEIFRGKSEVQDGTFTSRFFVSAGARPGRRGAVRCFATDGVMSASGILDSLTITRGGLSDDVDPPEIELVYGGETVAPLDTMVAGGVVGIRMWDESGVAIKGKGEVPAVSIAFDDVERVNLADSVWAVDGDYTLSEAEFDVPALPEGEHTLSVVAFDNLNRRADREYDIYIASETVGAANTVYAYPNPAHDVCYIIWDYENDDGIEVDVTATIYTVSGREVWTGVASGPGSHLQIRWDGTDVVGDAVANGTYLVVVEAAAASEPGFSTRDTIVLALIR